MSGPATSGPATSGPAIGELIAPVENENRAPLNTLEGGGVLSSWSDLGNAMPTDRAWDADEIGFAAAASALDTLGVAMNPLGMLASAGVGWLIEHVEFLHEPLDWLAGDPTQIKAQAHTWHNMSTELGRIAGRYSGDVAALSGWDGAALDAYREAAGQFTSAVGQASSHAETVSQSLTSTGATVGTVRATIRDVIADFVGEVIGGALAALAAGPATGGGSIAAFTAYAITRASETAAELSQRVAKLLAKLSAAADKLAAMVRRFGGVAAGMSRGLRKVDSFPAHIDGRLLSDFGGRGTITRYLDEMSRTPPDVSAVTPSRVAPMVTDVLTGQGTESAVELGKQTTKAEQQRADWKPVGDPPSP